MPRQAKRLPLQFRAGTHLDHRFTEAIYGRNRWGDEVQHGWYESKADVYQGGGEAENFIYRKKRCITIDGDAWHKITLRAPRIIEMIDNPNNLCYSVPYHVALVSGALYVDKQMGERFQIPLHLFQVRDANDLPATPDVFLEALITSTRGTL